MTDDQIIHVLTALFIAIVAHRLTIGRDQRHEFNEIATPLRAKLRHEANHPSPAVIAISRDEADALAIRLWWMPRRGFLECCENYWCAHHEQNQDAIGQPSFKDAQAVQHAIAKILPYTLPH